MEQSCPTEYILDFIVFNENEEYKDYFKSKEYREHKGIFICSTLPSAEGLSELEKIEYLMILSRQKHEIPLILSKYKENDRYDIIKQTEEKLKEEFSHTIEKITEDLHTSGLRTISGLNISPESESIKDKPVFSIYSANKGHVSIFKIDPEREISLLFKNDDNDIICRDFTIDDKYFILLTIASDENIRLIPERLLEYLFLDALLSSDHSHDIKKRFEESLNNNEIETLISDRANISISYLMPKYNDLDEIKDVFANRKKLLFDKYINPLLEKKKDIANLEMSIKNNTEELSRKKQTLWNDYKIEYDYSMATKKLENIKRTE